MPNKLVEEIDNFYKMFLRADTAKNAICIATRWPQLKQLIDDREKFKKELLKEFEEDFRTKPDELDSDLTLSNNQWAAVNLWLDEKILSNE